MRTWLAVALQFLFGVTSLVAVLVPTMLVRQHYERLIATNRAGDETLAPFVALVHADLIIAAATTAAAIGTLLWFTVRRGRRRHTAI